MYDDLEADNFPVAVFLAVVSLLGASMSVRGNPRIGWALVMVPIVALFLLPT